MQRSNEQRNKSIRSIDQTGSDFDSGPQEAQSSGWIATGKSPPVTVQHTHTLTSLLAELDLPQQLQIFQRKRHRAAVSSFPCNDLHLNHSILSGKEDDFPEALTLPHTHTRRRFFPHADPETFRSRIKQWWWANSREFELRSRRRPRPFFFLAWALI